MSYNFSPKIVTENLVLYLDAANTKSYPGSGTIWTDLSRGGNIGTLTNGPTFNSSNGGSIVFDGTNQYINLGDKDSFTIPTGFSFDCFFNPNGLSGSILEKYGNSGTNTEYVFGFFNNQLYGWVSDTNSSQYRGRIVSNLTTYTNSNQWGHFCFIYNGGTLTTSVSLYVNGIKRDNSDFTGGNFTNIKNGSSALTFANANLGLAIIKGSIGNIRMYNRALSALEVLQNYNATKSRYNLT